MNPVRSLAASTASSTEVAEASPIQGQQGSKTVRIGIVGCGAFARFSAEQYRRLPVATIACVADADPDAATRAAGVLHASVVDPDALLVSGDVDFVYIATPPEAHFRQARAALRAGKHVLVEKPLATTLSDAQELEAVAAREGLVCVANLVERYNPLAESIRRLIESRILGDLVHGVFLNEAADEGLPPDHWFWNREASGGIFVEHGVHFFDLASSWLGPGRVVAAARGVRPALRDACGDGEGADGLPEVVAPVEEQVSCTCRYAADGWTARTHPLVPEGFRHEPHSGVLFHFEHGFHQPSRLDRQEMRLVFERGEVRLYEWVLSHGFLRAIVDDSGLESLARMLPGGVAKAVERFEAGGRRLKGRFRGFEATQIVEMSFTTGLDKSSLYGRMVHDLAADQLARVRNPLHVRRLTEADSVAAVAMACEADRMAIEAG